MIPQDTVNQIIEAADVVEVVSEFVNLKKRGANMIACCPFHNEKTPSFSVSPSKGIYKCFGCGKGGDAVRFVMDIEGFSYPDALRWLAKKYNIEIKEREITDTELQAQNEKESLFIVSEFAADWFHNNLFHSEEGNSIGLSYFLERGFSKPMIEKFKLGYALDARSEFYEKASAEGFTNEVLEKAGLVNAKENNIFLDRFRGRVIFPIHNVAGKPIAFGARILKTDAKAPKYINSPETDIYHKSKIVYGIYQAKNAIRQKENCFLVEGYTDVVSLHQAGIENVVASSGTSLTEDQIRQIGRFTENVTVLYDGDAAGIRASLRGIDLILEQGLNVKAVVFPNGDDPDSYIRKVGGEVFTKYVESHQKDFIHFKTEISLEEVGTDAIKKAELIESLVLSISKIPNPVKRQIFYQEVAKLLNIDEQILYAEGGKLISTQIRAVRKSDGGKIVPAPFQRNIEEEFLNSNESLDEDALIRDLVLYGQVIIDDSPELDSPTILADYIFSETEIDLLTNPTLKRIYSLYFDFYSKEEVPPERYFVSNPDSNIQEMAINWLSSPHGLSPNWEKMFEVMVDDYKDKLAEFVPRINFRIHLLKVKRELKELLEKLGNTEDEAEEDILMNAIKEKNETKKLISTELGSII